MCGEICSFPFSSLILEIRGLNFTFHPPFEISALVLSSNPDDERTGMLLRIGGGGGGGGGGG